VHGECLRIEDVGDVLLSRPGHLSQGTIQVKVGDRVKLGQPIARVGNSGNTSEPHVHIQAQSLPTGIGDVATLDAPVVLRTLHTYPLLFSDVVLIRRGVESRPAAADPRRGDSLRPAN
jgi:murein DD-endopeptidase MepM/ murein hydrolase activator NlpD